MRDRFGNLKVQAERIEPELNLLEANLAALSKFLVDTQRNNDTDPRWKALKLERRKVSALRSQGLVVQRLAKLANFSFWEP